MRKVLAQIIKGHEPARSRQRNTRCPEQTIQDVRQCLGLISLRERELATLPVPPRATYYSDENHHPPSCPWGASARWLKNRRVTGRLPRAGLHSTEGPRGFNRPFEVLDLDPRIVADRVDRLR